MQDAALFFRHQAYSCFHRRRLYLLLSAEWRHEVDDARRFIRHARTEWLDRPGHGRSARLSEITYTVFAMGPYLAMQRKHGGFWHPNRTQQETEEAAFQCMLRNRAAAVPKNKLTAEMIENPRFPL